MRFNNDLAAIHGYLCSDGYVIRNPETQKHKYYQIGLRNTNNLLLKDFQKRFFNYFGIKPIITNEGRCKINNKRIYYILTKEYSYYSYEWKLPKLSKNNLCYWLRAFFDAEGWVENQIGKSRLIGADCCNESGLISIQNALKRFRIDANIKKKKDRTIWRLTICGLNDLNKFNKKISFLHPEKKQKLIEAISSYRDFIWRIPKTKKELFNFIQQKGKIRSTRKEIRFYSIEKINLINLKKSLKNYNITSNLFGPWINNSNSLYYCLIIKNYPEVFDGRRT